MSYYAEVFEIIQKRIVPKYNHLEFIKVHILPDNFKENILLICKIPVDFFIEDKLKLENNIIQDFNNYFDRDIVEKINIVFIKY